MATKRPWNWRRVRAALDYYAQIWLQRLRPQDIPHAVRFMTQTHEHPDPIEHVFTVNEGIVRPKQVRSEIQQLAGLVSQHQPKAVLEIGTATGGTLFLWARMAAPDATIVSVDLPGGVYGGGYPLWKAPLYRRFASKKQSVKLLRRDSHSPATLEAVRNILDEPLDFLFIDGDHSYDGVKQDFEMYAPLVRPGGIVALHDIVDCPPELLCEVKVYWDEIKHRGQHWEFIEDPAQGWAGIGAVVV